MCRRHRPSSVSRRDLLRLAAAGAGVVALGPLARGTIRSAHAAPGPQTRLVLVNLIGGNDGHNTVVPVNLQPYYDARPTLALPSGACLDLAVGPNPTTACRLHPALTQIAALWAEGSVAIVQKVGYPEENLSHFTSSDIYSFGVRGSFANAGVHPSGWISRFADLYAPTPLGAVALGVGRPRDFIGGTSQPFLVGGLSQFRFLGDARYPANHLHRLASVRDALASFGGGGVAGDVRDALDQAHALTDRIQQALTAYGTGTVTYPTNSPGRSLRDAAVLIEGGFETRVFYTGFGGFDTHGDQGGATGQHATLLGRLDAAVGAFATDLKARGVWDRTAIVVLSEFGRRNYENGSGGTDHGHGNVFLVIGGAVRGGVYGPALAEPDLTGEYPGYDVDFRDVYRDVLRDHLDVDPSPVFPEAQEKNVTLGLVA
jgi:uncharacterized protein (DUF1501 family)